ncbi:MAG: aminotransferase class I/II-fold pyridoxal phosphate-dependent enzyme [bacterium]|nr:aminotransferase class I/II-fold pyridoxal phosphate-dependent enzyme [bacterium]
MDTLNQQAKDLNEIIQKYNPNIFELLSQKGKAIFYPKEGILAQGAEAKGKEINATLGTAWTNDDKPMVLPSIADKINISPENAFPYAPSFGLPELRTKWKELLFKKNPSLEGKKISKPVVTCALTHGLSICGYLFADAGAKLLLPNLFWGNYRLVFQHGYDAGLQPYNFFFEGDFDIQSFKDALDKNNVGKKIVVLNFPNNPSGYSPTLKAADRIKKALLEAAQCDNKIVVLLDDAYFGLAFEDGIYKESLFAELADLHENILAVKVDGITKEDYAWGFRVGFLTYGVKNAGDELYEALELKTAGAIRGNISNAPHLSQSLALQSLNSQTYDDEKGKNFLLLKERYSAVKGILKNHPEYKEYFEALPYNSGYFMCVRLKDLDAETVRKHLLQKYSTGLIAIKDLLRVAYSAIPTPKLEKLFHNVFLACRDCAG